MWLTVSQLWQKPYTTNSVATCKHAYHILNHKLRRKWRNEGKWCHKYEAMNMYCLHLLSCLLKHFKLISKASHGSQIMRTYFFHVWSVFQSSPNEMRLNFSPLREASAGFVPPFWQIPLRAAMSYSWPRVAWTKTERERTGQVLSNSVSRPIQFHRLVWPVAES